ncbi:MAG: hypothetical protein M1831_002082 [Alyxoria varia]|nr:MAG: hypothetical protein M1831_002082 [Alyxoria varia]
MSFTWGFVASIASLFACVTAQNAPSGVKTWCGKAYSLGDASFEPGGWLEEPEKPDLNLQLQPRMSYYVNGEDTASFFISTGSSRFDDSLQTTTQNSSHNETLHIQVSTRSGHGAFPTEYHLPLAGGFADFSLPLRDFKPSSDPTPVHVKASNSDALPNFTATAQLPYQPPIRNEGSMVRIDNLYGGLMVPDHFTSNPTGRIIPLFPYSFYIEWYQFYKEGQMTSVVRDFKSRGYNIAHIVPDHTLDHGFYFDHFNAFLDACDEQGLWVMYDMRYTYQNDSFVEWQVNQIKHRKSLLLWYTGDEPDGVGDPLTAPRHTYDLIKSLDPYHPVSLCLNCYNYHYEAYSSGADIILEDVYPIAVNTTFSSTYHTPCNTTYGCCGCDNCHLGAGLSQIPQRLDRLAAYQEWLGGGAARKPIWGVPQAFGGAEFWERTPTRAEEAAMDFLSVNHGAKGLVAWKWPTTKELQEATSEVAKVLTDEEVVGFTLGARLVRLDVMEGAGGVSRLVDAAAWRQGSKMLVSVVNTKMGQSGRGYPSSALTEALRVELPAGVRARGIGQTYWGDGGAWSVDDEGRLVKSRGMKQLEVHMMVVDLA